MHPRALIRNAFTERLKTAVGGVYPTRAGARVFPTRIAPVDTNELKEDGPAILIYSREERIHAEKDYSPQGLAAWIERDLQLVTEGMLAGGATVDDDLDALGEEIETCILDWEVPGLETARIRLIEVDIDLVVETVKRPVGCIGLVWQVRYRSQWRPRADADDIDAFLSPQARP